MGFYLNQLEECLASSLVTVVQIQNDKINTYAIVKHPINNNYYIIFFDKKSSPSFQGINHYDVFNDITFLIEYIKCSSILNPDQSISNNVTITKADAIAGLVTDKNNKKGVSLLLIRRDHQNKFQDPTNSSQGSKFYNVESFLVIPLSKQTVKIKEINVEGFYYSFNYNILSFQGHASNKHYNIFHLNQKAFHHLQINFCPFVIYGLISSMDKILLVCRRLLSFKIADSGISEDGETQNQSEIELIVSERKFDGTEVSFFTVTFGDMPISYKPKDENWYPFFDTPKFILNLLDNQKDKMKNEVYLIDASNEYNEIMRQATSFLSGVFHIIYLPICIDTKLQDKKCFQKIYSSFPELKLRKQLILDQKIFNLDNSDQVFYICSNTQNLNAQLVTILLLCKVINFFTPKNFFDEDNMLDMIFPFFQDFINLVKKTDLPIFKSFCGEKLRRSLKASSINTLILPLNLPLKNKAKSLLSINVTPDIIKKRPEVTLNSIKIGKLDLKPPEKMEKCVSLFPTATIVEPLEADNRILSRLKTSYFYQKPETPIIINLTEICRVSSFVFTPATEKPASDENYDIYNIFPSMVCIYGGLYINQMFPIVENLPLSWHTDTIFRVDSNNYYSTNLKYSKYGKVRFISFHFKSPFKAFYLPNIEVYSEGSDTLNFPKKIKAKELQPIDTFHANNLEYMKSEFQRIVNDESIQLFVSKNQDKINDLLNINKYFKERQNEKAKKTDEFIALNNILSNNELAMMVKKYPFLLNKNKLKSNFMKINHPNSTYIPLLLASGPPLFEYVIGQKYELPEFHVFEPKESIIILKLVTLHNYLIDKLEIRCKYPLLVEILNNNRKYLFYPPGNEHQITLEANIRVIDVKIIGNPINITFFGISSNVKSSYEIETVSQLSPEHSRCPTPSKYLPLSLKCNEFHCYVQDSQIQFNETKEIIGLKFTNYNSPIYPRFLLFDDKDPLYVKASSNAFFLPKIMKCKKLKIFDENLSNVKCSATIFIVDTNQDSKPQNDSDIYDTGDNHDDTVKKTKIQKIIDQKPFVISISKINK